MPQFTTAARQKQPRLLSLVSIPVVRDEHIEEVGIIEQWTRSKKGDDAFKDYRWEYRKRFARMKAGTLPTEEFYAWNRKAREKKPPVRQGNHTDNSDHRRRCIVIFFIKRPYHPKYTKTQKMAGILGFSKIYFEKDR